MTLSAEPSPMPKTHIGDLTRNIPDTHSPIMTPPSPSCLFSALVSIGWADRAREHTQTGRQSVCSNCDNSQPPSDIQHTTHSRRHTAAGAQGSQAPHHSQSLGTVTP